MSEFLLNNIVMSSDDTLNYKNVIPKWSENSTVKSNWDTGAYLTVNDYNGKLYIQMGENEKKWAGVRFMWLNYNVNVISENERIITFDLTYTFTYLAFRRTDYFINGYKANTNISVFNKEVYNIDYTTGDNYDDSSRKTFTKRFTLNPQETISDIDIFNMVTTYENNVFPPITLKFGFKFKNIYPKFLFYYPGKTRDNTIFNNSLIKNRLKSFSKDSEEYQNVENKGNFRYRKGGKGYQIPKL